MIEDTTVREQYCSTETFVVKGFEDKVWELQEVKFDFMDNPVR